MTKKKTKKSPKVSSPKNKGGRKPIPLDEALIYNLATIHCTVAEIAAMVGCSKDTLERRCAALIKKGKDIGKASLRRHQWKAAEKGSIPMLIWLGKQLLEQQEHPHFEKDEIDWVFVNNESKTDKV